MRHQQRNFISLSLAAILLGALIIGCAGQKAMWGDEKSGFILAYRTDGGTQWQYESTTNQLTSMEMQGQAMETTSKTALKYTIKDIQKENNGNLKATVTIDNFEITVQSMQGEMKPDVSTLIGKSFGITFSPTGKMIARSGLDTIKIDLGPVQGGEMTAENFFRELFTRLPEKPIKIGDSWDTPIDETVKQSGMDVFTKGTTKNTVVGKETVNGFECLKVKSETTANLTGEGERMGMPITMEGDMSSNGIWFFAYKEGLLVKMEQNLLMEGSVAVTGAAEMTIPISQEPNTTLNLLSAK